MVVAPARGGRGRDGCKLSCPKLVYMATAVAARSNVAVAEKMDGPLRMSLWRLRRRWSSNEIKDAGDTGVLPLTHIQPAMQPPFGRIMYGSFFIVPIGAAKILQPKEYTAEYIQVFYWVTTLVGENLQFK